MDSVSAPWNGPPISLSHPCLGEAEQAAVVACMQSNWISSLSPEVSRFETAFAEHLGLQDAVAVQCGTAALHLAMRLCDIKPGDRVAVPALSFTATVNPVCYQHAIPVFVDVEPTTFGLCPESLAHALKRNPDITAVVVTHLYGHAAAVEDILTVIEGRPLIEDAAEALGSSTATGQALGTLGRIGCFSFNGNKLMTTGSGGMLVSPQAVITECARHLAMQARVRNTLEFDHTELGYNYRMNGIQAAIGYVQLTQRLEGFKTARLAIARRYAEGLEDLAGLSVQHLRQPGALPWLSTVLTRDRAQRDQLMKACLERQIEVRPFFRPLNGLAAFAPFAGQDTFPDAHWLWERGVCLPSSSTLTPEQQQGVINTIRYSLNHA